MTNSAPVVLHFFAGWEQYGFPHWPFNVLFTSSADWATFCEVAFTCHFSLFMFMLYLGDIKPWLKRRKEEKKAKEQKTKKH